MKVNRLVLTAALIGFSLGLGTGCQSLISVALKEPKVQLQGIEVRNPTPKGSTVVVILEVMNPNSVALEVDQLNYVLHLGAKKISEAKIEKLAMVQAKTTAPVEVPIPVQYDQVFDSVLELLSAGSIPYRVIGTANIGLFTLPFEQAGDLKIR